MRRDTAGLLSAGVTRATLGLRVGMEYLELMETVAGQGHLDSLEKKDILERLVVLAWLVEMEVLARMGSKENKDIQGMMEYLDSKEPWVLLVRLDLQVFLDQGGKQDSMVLMDLEESMDQLVLQDLMVLMDLLDLLALQDTEVLRVQ